MDVIRESPLTQAHFYWRCAEQSSSNAGTAAGYMKVVRQLELVRAVSRDDQIQSLLQKQIEFHQRRVSLLRMHNGEEPETELVESEEDISIVREDLEEFPDSPEETEASPEVDASPYKEIEESNSCAAEDNVGDSDTCLLERIERLEKEKLNLKLSLQQEREKNAALTRKIAEIRNDVSNELK